MTPPAKPSAPEISDADDSQAALRASETRYRHIFETNQAIKLIINPANGRIVEANQAAIDFYGYDAATLTKMRIEDINTLPQTDIRQILAQTITKKQSFFNFEHRLASGEIRQVEAYPAPIDIAGQTFIYVIIHDVTERHRAEESLKRATALLNESQRIAKIGSYETNLQTATWIGSDSFIEIFGLPRKEQYTLEEFRALVHPADVDEVMAYFNHCLATQQDFNYEYRCRRPDGQVIYVSSRSKVFYSPEGVPLKILGIKQDITERIAIEEKLRQNEASLLALIENTDGSIWSVDRDYRLIVGNSVFGRNISVVRGYPLAPGELVLADDLAAAGLSEWRSYYDRALRGEQFTVESRMRVVDESRYVAYRFNPIYTAEGKVVGVTVYGRDITAQKQVQEELQKRLSYEHLLADISALAIPVNNLEAFQTQCINLMANALNVSRIYIIEHHYSTNTDSNTFEWVAPGISPQKEFLQRIPSDSVSWWQAMMKANKVVNFKDIEDIPGENEREILRAQNIKSILAVPLFVAGKYYGFIGFDECRAQRTWPEEDVQLLAAAARVIAGTIERKQIEQQLVQQERLAAVGQLAAGIAHDFNNILAVMLGYAEILRTLPDTPPTTHQQLDHIITAGQRAAHLVRQILDFSQKTIRHPQQLDLGLFLKESMLFLKHTLSENIRLDLQLWPGEYWVEADPAQLQQVLTNLAINARDAMLPEGGALQLALSHVSDASEHICAVCQQPIEGEWVQITMSDTGQGIAPQVLPRVFEPFFTTKTVGQGVGLGLSQIAGVVEQHRGHIYIESEPGQGATVMIYLPPLAVSTAALAQTRSLAAGAGQGETILLVEDEPEVREATAAMLEYLGYHVIIAANGEEALAEFEKNQPNIDLVLSDMVMPDINGEELFHRLKAREPHLKLVMMSGYPLTDIDPELLAHGVTWFQKPVSFRQLAQIIGQALSTKVGRWD